jgi:polyisoprenyl-teichoic acid--peptidoglycan teichoic acid transferase
MRFITRIFRFITLRLIPTLVIVGSLWFGFQVAEAFVRQIVERVEYQTLYEDAPLAATRVAQDRAGAVDVPLPSDARNILVTDHLTDVTAEVAEQSASPEPSPSATPLPSMTATPTQTTTHTPTETATQTATSIPTIPTETATNTPTDLPSETNTQVSEGNDLELAQSTNTPAAPIFATNTPRSVIFATNTPAGQDEGEAVPPTTIAIATSEPSVTVVPPSATTAPSATRAATSTIEPTVPAIRPTATNTLPPFFYPRTAEPGKVIDGINVPTQVPEIQRDYNLMNIVLLGGDDELTGEEVGRTDTMIVVSINKDTGTVSMLSLPRDLFVYVPTEEGLMRRLNTVFGIGESLGWEPNGGFGLLRDTLYYNFGINVQYYARVNFSGFQEIIDTLGGVPVAVDCAYQDYRLIGAELPEGAQVSEEDEYLYTVDIGYYEMSGAQALWYARTRRSATDFDRGRRQQQILRSMWRTALDTGQLANLPQLWGDVTAILDTNVDITDVLGLVPIALNLNVSEIRSYTFDLGYHTLPITVTGNDGVAMNVHQPLFDLMQPVLQAFYRPPSNSQVLVEGATIAVYNATDNLDWDRVAAQRLGWEGFRASWYGEAETNDQEETILIDRTGQQKGSSLNEIASVLNVRPENIRVEPDPNREADFEVILGDNYNSCTYDGIVEVE